MTAFAAAVALLLLLSASFVWFFGWDRGTPDVKAYWDAGLHLRQGGAVYGPVTPGVSPKAFLYPPVFAALFAPLTLLPALAGYATWMALHFLFLAIVVAGCLRLAKLDDQGTVARFVAMLLLWLPAAVGSDFQEGQVNLLVLALVVTALAWIEDGRDRAGGALLGLAVQLKLLPVLLFATLLLQRRYRAVASGVVAALLLLPLPAVLTIAHDGLAGGPARAVALYGEWFHVVLAPAAGDAKVVGDEQFYVLNNSLAAVLHRLFSGAAFSPFPQLAGWHGPLLFELPRFLLRALAGGGGLALLAVALACAWRSAGSRSGRNASAALALAAVELATLNCWEHHLVLVALMLAPLAARPLSASLRALTAGVFALWTLPYLLDPLLRSEGRPQDMLLSVVRAWGFPTLALLALFVMLARETGRDSRPAAP